MNHIMTVKKNNKDVLFNTITLQENDNTNRNDSIEKRLFAKPTDCTLLFATSWMCNLRCSHCSVLHQLEKSSQLIDIEKCKKFIDNYSSYYGILSFNLHFIGGEVLLYPEVINRLIDVLSNYTLNIGINTNLAITLTIPIIRVLEKSNTIRISLDGLEKEHNQQRHGIENPFLKTIGNIKALIKLGLKEKINILCTIKDEFQKESYKKKFFDYLNNIGISNNQIIFGCIHPTKLSPTPQNTYLKVLKSPNPIIQPCCKYRFMSNFVVDSSNKIFSNYFSIENSLIGNLDDSINKIENTHKEQIKKTMACLHDKKCQECPVIGFCWGKCISGEPLFDNKPSNYCDQESLINKVKELCSDGTVWNLYDKTHCST